MHISTQGRTWVTEVWDSEDGAGGATASMMTLSVEGIEGLGEAGKYRLEKGFEFKSHRHRDWVVVTVVSGRVRVAPPGGGEPTVYEPGDVYLVKPGEVHRETMLEDTEVVVVNGPGVVGERYETHTVEV